MPGLTVLAVPQRFQAGQSRTSGVEPESRFMATAPPREEPTITSGPMAVVLGLGGADGRSKSSSSRAGLTTSWPCSIR